MRKTLYRIVTLAPECLVSKLQQVTSWLSLNLYGASVCSSVSLSLCFTLPIWNRCSFWICRFSWILIDFVFEIFHFFQFTSVVFNCFHHHRLDFMPLQQTDWKLLCFDACRGEHHHSRHKNDPNLLRDILYFIPPIYCCAINNCNRPENNREFNLRGAANWLRCEPLNCLSQTNSSMESATGKVVLWTIMYNTSCYFLTRLWDWTLDWTALRSAHPHTEACRLLLGHFYR